MIRFENIFFGYEKNVPVFQELNLDLDAGLTLLLGPNGSGKTTLLKMAAGVELSLIHISEPTRPY